MRRWILTAVTTFDPDGWRRVFAEVGYTGDYYWTLTDIEEHMSGALDQPRITAGVVLVNAAGEVLMQLRDDRPDITDPGHWVVPGGGVDPGETLEAGARREFFEETGYRLGAVEFFHVDRVERSSGVTSLRHFFRSRYDGVQPLHCYEGQEIRFMSPMQIDQLETSPGMKQVVHEALRRFVTRALPAAEATGRL